MEEIGNIHVVHNQYALERAGHRRLQVHKDRYNELKDSKYGSRLSPEDMFIHTSQNPEHTVEEMAENFHPGDVFALFVGDGGFHDVINGIHRLGAYSTLGMARFLVIDRGFASDGAKQLNPRHALNRPSTILERGTTVDFAPLLWEEEGEYDRSDYLVNLYGTIGASALVARDISSEQNRRWAGDNWIKKALVTREASRKAPLTTVAASENGERRQVYDLGFANGSHMSGFAHAFRVALEEPRSIRYEITSRNYVLAGIKLALGRISGEYQTDPYTLYLPNGAAAQLDGEGHEIPPKATVTVSQQDEEKFRVFAHRP